MTHQDCFLMLGQTDEIKIRAIATYGGIHLTLAYTEILCVCIYMHTHTYTCVFYTLTVLGFTQRDLTPLNLTDMSLQDIYI